MHCEPPTRLSEAKTSASADVLRFTPDPTTGERSSLDHFLDPLRKYLDDPQVTELCINSPGEAFVERYTGWARQPLPFVTFAWCQSLAKLVANYTKQRVSDTEPILSATLPSGERIQFVLPPATGAGDISITIRRPSSALWTLEQLSGQAPINVALSDGKTTQVVLDVFATTEVKPRQKAVPTYFDDGELLEEESELVALLERRQFAAFIRKAVRCRKNILLSGATGSGKTTISKALILEVPAEDRIVTIEDVKELSLQNQPNNVRLYYSQGGQGIANVTAGSLLASAKRMRPDRVFVSELRTGDEVYDYLVSVNSGHPGSITSVHADSAQMAFVALAQLMKRSEAGKGMSTAEGIELAQLSVDIVVQCSRRRQRRYVSEIWYDPSTKRRGVA